MMDKVIRDELLLQSLGYRERAKSLISKLLSGYYRDLVPFGIGLGIF